MTARLAGGKQAQLYRKRHALWRKAALWQIADRSCGLKASALGARADQGLGCAHEPSRPHSDHPITGRSLRDGQARITLATASNHRTIEVEEVVLGAMPDGPCVLGALLIHESVSLSLGSLERPSLARVPELPSKSGEQMRGSLSRPGILRISGSFTNRAQPCRVPAWARTFLPGWL
jgi:hypothetical protein